MSRAGKWCFYRMRGEALEAYYFEDLVGRINCCPKSLAIAERVHHHISYGNVNVICQFCIFRIRKTKYLM